MAGQGLLERLDQGAVICAEGYLFELERRGYVQAGAFVPEVVLEQPDVVLRLHRDFVHARSDVVEAFTYYSHREKLKILGKEEILEPLNRQALALAKEVAEESGALFAGNICNTNVFDPDDPSSRRDVRAAFDEQVGWAADADVDYIIGETYTWLGEAQIALEAIRSTGRPAVITMALHRHERTPEGLTIAEACRSLAPRTGEPLRLAVSMPRGGRDARTLRRSLVRLASSHPLELLDRPTLRGTPSLGIRNAIRAVLVRFRPGDVRRADGDQGASKEACCHSTGEYLERRCPKSLPDVDRSQWRGASTLDRLPRRTRIRSGRRATSQLLRFELSAHVSNDRTTDS